MGALAIALKIVELLAIGTIQSFVINKPENKTVKLYTVFWKTYRGWTQSQIRSWDIEYIEEAILTSPMIFTAK